MVSAFDTLYINGNVITVNPSDDVVEALAVKGDKIAALGTSDELRQLADEDTRIVDLAGRTMMPGFIDPHSHFPNSGKYGIEVADLNAPPIGGIKTMAELQDALRDHGQARAGVDWILGRGYDDTLIAEGRHPTRHDLDQVSTERPIFISHVSGHLGSCNTKALEIAGVGAETQNPAGGVIRREGNGTPDGVFEEPPAMGLVRRFAPGLNDGEEMEVIKKASAEYISRGVTSAQNAASDENILTRLQEGSAAGHIPLRMLAFPSWNLALQISAGEKDFDRVEGHAIGRGAAKVFQDGSIQGYTGYLTAPYHVPFQGDKDYLGYPIYPKEQLMQIVADLHKAGWQIAIHGNGDAAIDDILAAFRAAQEAHPRPDPRHIIVHSQMAREDQLDEMAALGVIPSFFTLHTYYWGDRHRDIFIGPDRGERISPAKSALERNMHFTIHCDTPVVPMTPLLLIWAAVNRITTGGRELGGEQRLSPMQAIRASTIEGAYQSFEEDIKGSLEVGKLADLVILSGDPLSQPKAIRDMNVLHTIIGGATVYSAPDAVMSV